VSVGSDALAVVGVAGVVSAAVAVWGRVRPPLDVIEHVCEVSVGDAMAFPRPHLGRRHGGCGAEPPGCCHPALGGEASSPTSNAGPTIAPRMRRATGREPR